MADTLKKLQNAREAYQNENFQKAIDLFSEALAETPTGKLKTQILIDLAFAEVELGLQKGSKFIQKAKLEDAESYSSGLAKGLFLQYLQKDLSAARNEFEGVLENHPNDSFLREKLIKNFVAKAFQNCFNRFWEKVNYEIRNFELSNAITPEENEIIQYFKNMAYEELQSEKEELEAQFGKVTIEGDDEFDLEERKIQKLLEKISYNGRDWVSRLELGKIYFESCNLEFAKTILEEAHDLVPDNEEITSFLTELYLPPSQKQIGVVRNLPILDKREGFLRYNKISRFKNKPENLHLRFGKYFMRRNWLSLARKVYEDIPENFRNADILYSLGNLYLKLYQRLGKDTLELAIRNYELAKIKGFSNPDEVEIHLSECQYLKQMREEFAFSRRQIMDTTGLLVGNSKGISELKDGIAYLNHSNKAILVTGEQGSGKTTVSQIIHNTSMRRNKNFTKVNALKFRSGYTDENYPQDSLSHSVLIRRQIEFIKILEEANDSTILIKNIEELPTDLQEILVSAVETGKINHETGIREVKVYLIATTKKFQTLIQKVNFNQDLIELFSDSILEVPTLRSRKDDLFLLVDYFLKKLSEKYKKNNLELSTAASRFLEKYSFKENIRELATMLESAVQKTNGRIIRSFAEDDDLENSQPIRKILSSPEKIIEALIEANGNVSKTAELLGCDRSGLHRKIKKYKIEPKDYRNNDLRQSVS